MTITYNVDTTVDPIYSEAAKLISVVAYPYDEAARREATSAWLFVGQSFYHLPYDPDFVQTIARSVLESRKYNKVMKGFERQIGRRLRGVLPLAMELMGDDPDVMWVDKNDRPFERKITMNKLFHLLASEDSTPGHGDDGANYRRFWRETKPVCHIVLAMKMMMLLYNMNAMTLIFHVLLDKEKLVDLIHSSSWVAQALKTHKSASIRDAELYTILDM